MDFRRPCARGRTIGVVRAVAIELAVWSAADGCSYFCRCDDFSRRRGDAGLLPSGAPGIADRSDRRTAIRINGGSWRQGVNMPIEIKGMTPLLGVFDMPAS